VYHLEFSVAMFFDVLRQKGDGLIHGIQCCISWTSAFKLMFMGPISLHNSNVFPQKEAQGFVKGLGGYFTDFYSDN
jgi:hypothetical protein